MSDGLNRRRFLSTPAIAAAATATATLTHSTLQAAAGSQEYDELRTYRLAQAKKQKASLGYKGTVSKITKWFLKPTDFSQI